MSATDRFVAARYLAMQKLTPYFSRGLMMLRPVPIEGFRVPAKIREDGSVEQVPTMATDQYWRVYYDPAWLETLPVEQVAWMLVHELLHPLRKHHERAKNQPGIGPGAELLKNICQDAESDDDLRDLAKQLRMELPSSWIFPETIGQPEGKLWETYYHELLKKAHTDGGGQGGGENAGQGDGQPDGGGLPHAHCGSAATGVPQSYELPPDDPEAPGLNEADQQLVRENVAQDVLRYAREHKSRGTLPGWLERWAEEVLTPKGFDPYELLRSAVASALGAVRGRKERSYRFARWEHYVVFRKMLGPRAPVLPGEAAPVPTVGFIVDTSGSVSEEELSLGIGAVAQALRAFGSGNVYAMACDAAAGPLQRLFTIRDLKLVGGGGTSMTAGLRAMQSHKPVPDVVVVLTDGWTDWPTPSDVKGIRHLVWGIYHDKSRVPAGVPGRVIELSRPGHTRLVVAA